MKHILTACIIGVLLWLACGGDSESPVVEITSPADGSVVSATVVINIDATDNDAVDSVQIYIDADLVVTDTTEPYSYSWNTDSIQQDSSSHNLSAKAYDAAENEGVSDTITVTVFNDILSGNLKWQTFIGVVFPRSSPAIGTDGTIYIGSDDNALYAINPDGTTKWRYSTGNYVFSSPAIGADGTIYVGSYD
ncbi:MAG: Ig-like domain-containing protein, partial [bacterium]